MFKKILIANRGEIAVRILRACREMNIPAVVVFSEADRASLHVRMADEAYPIGPAPSRESYLVIDKILGVARASGCDSLHPGYGFLAENPNLARACAAAGVTFIGPSPEAMERLGSKTAARQLAREVGVPTVPGTLDSIDRIDDATKMARQIGFPVVLKAVAGGGGKGMRLVERESELAAAWRDASSETANAFGDGRMYLEKFLVQIGANLPRPGATHPRKRRTRSAMAACISRNSSFRSKRTCRGLARRILGNGERVRRWPHVSREIPRSDRSELAAAWRDASSETANAFGDGRMYLEKFLVQIGANLPRPGATHPRKRRTRSAMAACISRNSSF